MPLHLSRYETNAMNGSDAEHLAWVAVPAFSAPYAAPDERFAELWLANAPEAGAERRIDALATRLIEAVRAESGGLGGIEEFLHAYSLSTKEGLALMVLAEALLRVPDAATSDRLIEDKLAAGDWTRHEVKSNALLVSASAWALGLTARIVQPGETPDTIIEQIAKRLGMPAVRAATRQAMRLLGSHFVMGQSIEEALGRAGSDPEFRYSFDMLGEGARSAADAKRYFESYAGAIAAIGASAGNRSLPERPGISVKLSALHPRYEAVSRTRVLAELAPRVLELARMAKAHDLNFTIDAEEADRLELSLEVTGKTLADPSLRGWDGFGLAVQAYQKRAPRVIDWLAQAAESLDRRLMVRLVKGAYWDTEVKRAQERGLADYPVFTRKAITDLCYMDCAEKLMGARGRIFPQFATHNALTVASIVEAAGGVTGYEFQRLHGMGEALYDEVLGEGKLARPCRIYAPVGDHEDLLGYLVRRLLENGANTSFVNRLADEEAPITQIIRDPVEAAEAEREDVSAIKLLPRPRDIYWPDRKNSSGLALTEPSVRESLVAEMVAALRPSFATGPIVNGEVTSGGPAAALVICPHDTRERIGTVRVATPAHVDAAVAIAASAAHSWDRLGGPARARILEHAADLFERDRSRLMAVMVREAGKTLPNALGEVRETVDFLRYYAFEARRLFNEPVSLRSPTGETNLLTLRGRGPFACISPFNFPLAIFVGQVAAALAAGNTVIAKPAEQTPVTAFLATQLLHEAGVPPAALHLLPGGAAVGTAMVKDPRVRGVAFTGSNETAWSIHKTLAYRHNDIVPFIAETGGLNAMIADSSALPEQVVRDAVRSAFDSAGQRCSAARVLFIQNEIADHTLRMLAGAVDALDVGDPFDYATDLGPVIDEAAQDHLEAHKLRMQREARELVDVRLPDDCRAGTYVTPAVYEIDRMSILEREVFGPILHVVRFSSGHIDHVVDAINASGFGLTLGLHSRIESVADYVAEHARCGNLYVNRNQIGAIPGVQPFGGDGLSGTGPKAGGPNYLARFATERVRTTDITATGGNLQLLSNGATLGKQ